GWGDAHRAVGRPGLRTGQGGGVRRTAGGLGRGPGGRAGTDGSAGSRLAPRRAAGPGQPGDMDGPRAVCRCGARLLRPGRPFRRMTAGLTTTLLSATAGLTRTHLA